MNDAPNIQTLVELLRWRASGQADETLYTFLADGESQEMHLTYGELDRQARAIAARLQVDGPPQARAVLLYNAGLEFISAFFGCLYAGVIAVPAYPPRNPRHVPRIQTIATDADALFCLTSSAVLGRSRDLVGIVPGFERVVWLATDEISEEPNRRWTPPEITSNSLAYLQYTSGSTSTPKGVMVSHGNLLHNLRFLCDGRGHSGIVSWLPFFHDMGLIYAILQALYGGFRCVLMAPPTFLQRPLRWLQALSKYGASTAIAPNFAYELCVQKISDAEKKALDLSRWTMALNAAEPVRIETLERFAAAFAPCGFRAEFLKPAYGLAEATLGVTIASRKNHYHVKPVDKDAFARNRIVAVPENSSGSYRLIGCGQGAADQSIAIVNPETLRRCGPDEVGEIWLASPSVAQGYWKRPSETEETFRAKIADTGEGPFLRTGDLGFFGDDELFITGRLKDMIIIRGANHYPQDIELSAQRSHAVLQPDAGAAFSVEAHGEERLVIVQELVRHHKADLDQVIAAVREAVSEEHGVQVYAILLVKPLDVPKTSSGKIQRRTARQMFLENRFDIEREWRAELGTATTSARPEMIEPVQAPQTETTRTLETWFISRLSALLNIASREIDPRQPFSRYGLDSLGAVTLAGELQAKLNRPLPSSLLFDYPSVETLIRHLSAEPHATSDAPVRISVAEPIAIVGMACRFPGANNPREFWELLRDGGDAISEVPPDRWDVDACFDPNPATPGKMNTRWGGFLKNVDQFDAGFFEISPREAMPMDPQQRMLLEVAWEALENAGLPPASLAGTQAGVFVGISSFDYWLLQLRASDSIDAYAGTGIAHSVAANRISYSLDLRGPSLAVDTACSSSLVAVHQACESLRRGESELALVGGVNLILSPELTIALSQARMMAPDGRCKTFDRRADGYVRGEGCGILVLKRLSDAQAAGDSILAVIQGTAINQDGRSNGLTAPNGPAQEAVIQAALKNARLAPHEISYVECHGTGTSLGDPQEVEALAHVLGPGRAETPSCWIGSVKTNIGHLEAAAGIAGCIKVVLSLMHREIPPHLHFQALNPHIRLDQTPFRIPLERTPWSCEGRRRAGVSSFGFGGTNAHVILAESRGTAPTRAPVSQSKEGTTPTDMETKTRAIRRERPWHILTLSAKSAEALRNSAARMSEHRTGFSTATLADVCFSANAGRSHFDHRLALVAETAAQVQSNLAQFAAGQNATPIHQGQVGPGQHPKIAFLFTGQGSQYVGMARELYDTQPMFRRTLQRCDEFLRPELGCSLLSLLYPESGQDPRLDETVFAQPALFALEFALAELWQSWGIRPDAVLGHSVGEYVAACLSGVFDLEAGLKLIAARARLMHSLPPGGAMAAVFASADEVAQTLSPFAREVSIAAVNGPGVTVISGRQQPLEQALAALGDKNFSHQRLVVSHAFHSPLMEPILEEFRKISETVRYRPPGIPLVSNLTGDWFPPDTAPGADYWARHIREPVQFAKGFATLAASGPTVFLECGPLPTLLGLGKRCVPPETKASPKSLWLPSLRKSKSDWQVLLNSLAQFYVSGATIDWNAFDREFARTKVWLPTYPFQRSRFWVMPATTPSAATARTDDQRWQTVLDAGSGQSEKGFPVSVLENERARLAALNELAAAYTLRALETLAVFSNAKPRCNLASVCERLRLRGHFESVLRSWLNGLVGAGLLRHADGNYELAGAAPTPSPDALWVEAARRWDGELFFPELVKACGEDLADIITGRTDPLALLFPNGSWAAVEKIYRDSTLARYCNSILGSVLQALAQPADREQPRRILEVGAGTGGSTAHLLPLLSPDTVRYTFTDVGAGFVQQARMRFGEFPFVTYGVLDLERAPETQGFGLGSFDVIVAANVLHATRHVRETLGRVRSLLAPRGHLLIWEATARQPWLDVTFGLLEGWHHFEDATLRRDQPLLSTSLWCETLRETGFEQVAVFPATDSFGLGQSVIVARSGPSAAAAPTSSRSSGSAVLVSESWERLPKDSSLDDLFYEVQWRAGDSNPSPVTNQDNERGIWLLLADSDGTAQRLAERVENRGGTAILVWPGENYRSNGARVFWVRPDTAEDWSRLFGEMAQMGGTAAVRRIVHFWSLDFGAGEPISLTLLESAQRCGCESVVQILQQIAAFSTGPAESKLVWLVTRDVQDVKQEAQIQPAISQAPLWGLARVIALEHPGLWGGIVDLQSVRPDQSLTPPPFQRENGSANNSIARDADLLFDTIRRGSAESQWALREGRRFVPRLGRQSGGTALESARFLPGATYLITGGLGGMGLKVARWMAQRGARRFLLAGRTPLPPRKEWKRLAEVDKSISRSRDELVQSGGSLAEKISGILEIEQLGASVHLAAVDIADREGLASCLDAFAAEGWPPIRGVIHAAGVLEDHAVARMDRAAFDAAMRPKIIGTWLLHDLLRDTPLDFFVLFSSAAAVLGSAGQANHAAANSFLDSFARWRRAQGLAAQSINWGPWGEVGAAARLRHKSKMMAHGIEYLSTETGLAALERALRRDAVQTVILSVKWSQFLRSADASSSLLNDFAERTSEIGPTLAQRTHFPASASPGPRTPVEVETELKRYVAELLLQSQDRVDSSRPLSQLGFDSLMAVQLQNEIEANLGCHLPINEIVPASIRALAERIANESGNSTPPE